MRFIFAAVLLCLAVTCTLARPQDDEYDYDEEPPVAPVQTPAPTKPTPRHLLPNNRQARGPSPLLSRGASKTTAAPVKVQEPEILNEPELVEDEDFPDDAAPLPASSTTTVAPKKGVSPVVRPFRSNQDLLAALKRRRQQEQNGGTVATHSTPSATSSPAEKRVISTSNNNNNNNAGRRTFNRNKAPAPVQEVTSEQEVVKKPTSSSLSRRFSGRKTTSAPSADEEEVEEAEEPAPRSAKAYRGGRRS